MSAAKNAKVIAREAALWIGGALGAICLLSLIAGWALNVTPLVFASGSMSPGYDVGSLGIARETPASDLQVGDVVSVVNADGVRVTHRITAVVHDGSTAILTLKGDTNDVPDAQTYPVSSAPRVAFGVPYAGYVLNAAASPYGVAVSAAVVMGLLFLGFGASGGTPTGRRTRTLIPAGVASVLLVGGVAGASGAAPWAFTSAYWTDTATATTTASVAAPSDTTGPVLSAFGPANGSTRDLGNSGTSSWRQNCSIASNVVCVTAVDAGVGVDFTNPTYTLVSTSGANSGKYWNGTAFVTGTPVAVSAPNHTGNVIYSNAIAQNLVLAGNYTLTWKVKDLNGNLTTGSVSFSAA